MTMLRHIEAYLHIVRICFHSLILIWYGGIKLNIHESAENYLEMILILKERLGAVRSIDIVNEMDYSKPSVSVAMKKLRENGYVEVDTDGHISLTETGLSIANRMYQRHQSLTDFFIQLGVTPIVAAQDACKIEHHISDETFEKIQLQLKK